MNRYLSMNKKGAALAILPWLLVACGGDEGGQEAAPVNSVQEVGVVTIGVETVSLSRELPGRVAPLAAAEVRPQVGGLVLTRLFKEGEDVEEGQVLYEIDPASYEVAVAEAKARVASARAQLNVNRKRKTRVDRLASQDIASQQDKDDVTGSVSTAMANAMAMEAALDAAELALSRTKVLSPLKGRVERNSTMPGTMAVAFQTPLAKVTQLDPVYVDVVRSNTEILELRRRIESGHIKQKEGEVTVDILMEDGVPYKHPGKLAFSDATVDPETNMVTLRLVVPNPEHMLLPGMYVRAVIKEGDMDDAILAPQRGVSRNDQGEATCLVVTEDMTVEERILDVSRTIGRHWLVRSGLKPGDQVIVKGIQKVRIGQKVSTVPFVLEEPEASKASQEAPAPEGTGSQSATE